MNKIWISLVAALCVFLAMGCSGKNPASPTIVSFSIKEGSITPGHSGTLVSVYTNGTGSIDNGIGPVASGSEIATQVLLTPAKFTLTVVGQNGQTISSTYIVPVTNSTLQNLSQSRYGHTSTVLSNGKVLITGGYLSGSINIPPMNSVELYDPSTGLFTKISSMKSPRANHTATLLPSGLVLLVGGEATPVGEVNSAELYDPSTGGFQLTGSMQHSRAGHTATILASGLVLIGGGDALTATTACELYDPSAGIFSATGSMSVPRNTPTATLLQNGNVLFTGGGSYATAEIYNPQTGSFGSTGSMHTSRMAHVASLLSNGTVLITGGMDSSNSTLSTAEIFDASAGSFTTTGTMQTARMRHSVAILPNGKVVILGGYFLLNTGGTSLDLTSCEVYDPTGTSSTLTYSLQTPRGWAAASVLLNGNILMTGGESSPGVASQTSELFTGN